MSLTIFNNIDGCYAKGVIEGVMLSELSQSEKDKYSMISLICGIYNRQTKPCSWIQRTDWWLPEVGVKLLEMCERGQKGTNFQL